MMVCSIEKDYLSIYKELIILDLYTAESRAD